jgi:5-methylcytosine-specific restriction endonuclease McrA
MRDDRTEKRCKDCGEVKPIERFRPQARMASGRINSCYDCVYARDRARQALKPGERQRKRRAYYLANREKAMQQHRDWVATNPKHNLRRRLEVRGGGLPIPEEAIEYGLLLSVDPCSYCGGPADTLDHIVSLGKGGTHDWDNLTAACKSCNSRKNNGSLLDGLIRGTMLDEMENWATRWEQAA